MSASETIDRTAAEPEAKSAPAEDASLQRPVIFFDGVCGLCNRSVDFLLARDRNRRFLFAPLQGETARQRLSEEETQNLNHIVLWCRGKTFRASAAVARILWQLGGIWGVLGALFWLIPRPLRDVGYKVIAANRYRLFGRKETCRLPTPEERSRFLP